MTTTMTQGAYIGNIGEKMLFVAVLTYIASYDTKYGTTYIYTFKDEEENLIVWKTSSCLWINELDEHGDNILIHKGDKISFTATIKEHSEYQGVKQTMVQRLKDISMIEKKETVTNEQKAEKQRSLLEQGDVVYTMTYSRYKKHYPDCEIVCGSYNPDSRTVDVIVKKGRMKEQDARVALSLFICKNSLMCLRSIFLLRESSVSLYGSRYMMSTGDWVID